MAVRSYGLDMDFGSMWTVTLTLEIWYWYKAMKHYLIMDNNSVSIMSVSSKSNIPAKRYDLNIDLGYICSVTFSLKMLPWLKAMTHPWVIGNKCEITIQIQHGEKDYMMKMDFCHVRNVTLVILP